MQCKSVIFRYLSIPLLLGIIIFQGCAPSETATQAQTQSVASAIPPKTGQAPAPEFTLPDVEGVNHNIREWAGKVIILNFWATWCPPCRKETPLFVELQEQYGEKGLQFIGVAIDAKDKVQDFMDSYGVNYPMLIGANDAVKVSETYGNRLGGLPFTVVITRAGMIHYIQQGEFTRETAEKLIHTLL